MCVQGLDIKYTFPDNSVKWRIRIQFAQHNFIFSIFIIIGNSNAPNDVKALQSIL